MRWLLGFSIVATLVSHAVQIQNVRVSTAFRNAGIVPDVIPEVPRDLLSVNYPTVSICLGNEVTHTSTILPPQVEYDYKPNTNYTLLLFDPDLPAAATPAFRSTIHWIVVNIPGNNVAAGHTIAAYMPVILYPRSGSRRYVFLVYAQKKWLDVNDLNLIDLGIDRFEVSIPGFASNYNLVELVAGNYFISSYDLYERECRMA